MNQVGTDVPQIIFDSARWEKQIDILQTRYQNATPFPHIVLDDFLNPQVLKRALAEFSEREVGKWIHYVHVNERKYGLTDINLFGPAQRRIIHELNSLRFVGFLTQLTGIQGLFADGTRGGGGLHQSGPGGYLNIHADFTVHPRHRDWQRRINILVYLNEDWPDAYGGHLELWGREMRQCCHKILPVFNRVVIFNTDSDAFHGHPTPLRCPPGTTRKSIALYYFSKESDPLIRSTEYRPRPTDEPIKSLAIYLDKMVLRAYDGVKRRLGFDDDFASRTLKRIDEWFCRP